LLVDGDAVTEVANAGPVLGATPDATWAIEQVPLQPGQQLVVITDGITEASGPSGRFGEQRLRAELSGATGPSLAVQRLEEALGSFADGAFDDDAAILAIAPTTLARDGIDSKPGGSGLSSLPREQGAGTRSGPEGLVERLFDGFNRRDTPAIVSACDEQMEFFPVTAAKMGRTKPYVGPDGLHEYLADVAQVWEELLITPARIERRGDRMLVRGRVYLRNRELGIRDMPAAWIWDVRDSRLVRGEVFADPDEAVERFAQMSTDEVPGQIVAPGKF
jgi:ketosteroid isomerase-like protein